MENEAVPLVGILHRFDESDVLEHTTVEGQIAVRLDEEDLVVESLSHQIGMHVVQEDSQVLGSVAEWNDDGDLVFAVVNDRAFSFCLAYHRE